MEEEGEEEEETRGTVVPSGSTRKIKRGVATRLPPPRRLHRINPPHTFHHRHQHRYHGFLLLLLPPHPPLNLNHHRCRIIKLRSFANLGTRRNQYPSSRYWTLPDGRFSSHVPTHEFVFTNSEALNGCRRFRRLLTVLGILFLLMIPQEMMKIRMTTAAEVVGGGSGG